MKYKRIQKLVVLVLLGSASSEFVIDTNIFQNASNAIPSPISSDDNSGNSIGTEDPPAAQDTATDVSNITFNDPTIADSTGIKMNIISRINRYRSCHKAGPLVRNLNVESHAFLWAQELAKTGELKHSQSPGLGENIYVQSSPLEPSGEEPVMDWYCECFGSLGSYDYNSTTFSVSCGHFTQLVWKETADIGIGVAQGAKGFFVVANFKPPGNFNGRFIQNIERPSDPQCAIDVGLCP